MESWGWLAVIAMVGVVGIGWTGTILIMMEKIERERTRRWLQVTEMISDYIFEDDGKPLETEE